MRKATPAPGIRCERSRVVLQAVVEEHIQTGEPVASRALNKKSVPLSSALIRSVMAELEAKGYLFQPHTSAGRVPTQHGYREYVDHLMALPALASGVKKQVDSFFSPSVDGPQALLKAAADALADVSGLVAFAVHAPLGEEIHHHIEFVRMHRCKVLTILATRSGSVYHRPIQLDCDVSQSELERFQSYLNERFDGLSLNDINALMNVELEEVRTHYSTLKQRAMALSRKALPVSEVSEPEVIIGGRHNLFSFVEFSQADSARRVLEELERRQTWVKILGATLEDVGVQAIIGRENSVAGFQDCAVIAGSIHRQGGLRGTVGIVGPTRLEYGTAIAVIDWVKHHVDDQEANAS